MLTLNNTQLFDMEKFCIRGTKYTPDISFDPEEGSFTVKGISTPENSIDFYQSTYRVLERYANEGTRALEANIQLEYFNTSSAKCLYDIFKKLSVIDKNGHQVTVNWIYEEDDADMLESGEDYCELLPIQFKFVPVRKTSNL